MISGTEKNSKFFQVVQPLLGAVNGYYTLVWVKHLKSGEVRLREQDSQRWGEGSTRKGKAERACEPWALCLSPFVSIYPVSGTGQQIKDTTPAHTSLLPLRYTDNQPSQERPHHVVGRITWVNVCRVLKTVPGTQWWSTDVNYYYYLVLCLALGCSLVSKALWHSLCKALAFTPSTNTCLEILSDVSKGLPNAFNSQAVARLGSEMTKMTQGVCPWSDWRGRYHFHPCLTLGDGGKLEPGGRPASPLWAFRGRAATASRGGGGSLRRCLAFGNKLWTIMGLEIRMGRTFSLCTQNCAQGSPALSFNPCLMK